MKRLKKGQKLYTVGLDMQCRSVVTTSTFVKYEKNGSYDCVVKTASGFLMLAERKDYFLTYDEAARAAAA